MEYSDFMNMEVIRRTSGATIIFDYFENKPIKLIGFLEKNTLKTDFQIREDAFFYYQKLKKEINKNNP